MTTTCQICGREIKANTGLIAHHGYQRPGEGWQTASCMGARFRPYEVACDALPPAIDSCKRYIANQQAALNAWMTSPPDTITWQRKDGYGTPRGQEFTFERPVDFDPANHSVSYRQESYVFQFDGRKRTLEYEIERAQQSLRYLEKRLADWKPHGSLEGTPCPRRPHTL